MIAMGLTSMTSAGTIRATLGSVYGESVSYTLGSNATKGTTAGRFNWTRLTDDPATPAFNEAGTFALDPTPAGDLFYAFCIDLSQTVGIGGTYEFEVKTNLADGRDSAPYPTLGPSIAANLAKFLGAVFPSFGGSLSTVEAAALQIAIWEIIYETPTNAFNVASGNISFSNNANALSTATNYLNTFSTFNGASATGLHSLNNANSQDQIIQIPGNPNLEEIPEPGTYALMGIGLLAIGLFRRKLA